MRGHESERLSFFLVALPLSSLRWLRRGENWGEEVIFLFLIIWQKVHRGEPCQTVLAAGKAIRAGGGCVAVRSSSSQTHPLPFSSNLSVNPSSQGSETAWDDYTSAKLNAGWYWLDTAVLQFHFALSPLVSSATVKNATEGTVRVGTELENSAELLPALLARCVCTARAQLQCPVSDEMVEKGKIWWGAAKPRYKTWSSFCTMTG